MNTKLIVEAMNERHLSPEQLATACAVSRPTIERILDGTYVDVLIDGRFIEDQKDTTLFMRGSKNQKIHYLN